MESDGERIAMDDDDAYDAEFGGGGGGGGSKASGKRKATTQKRSGKKGKKAAPRFGKAFQLYRKFIDPETGFVDSSKGTSGNKQDSRVHRYFRHYGKPRSAEVLARMARLAPRSHKASTISGEEKYAATVRALEAFSFVTASRSNAPPRH